MTGTASCVFNGKCTPLQKKLTLNELDLDIIATGLFHKSKVYVANVHELSRKEDEFVYIEIKPLYVIDSIQERIDKKPVQIPNISYMLIPITAAGMISEKWRTSSRKDCFLIIFSIIKRSQFFCHSGNCKFLSIVIIPGKTVIAVDDYFEYNYGNLCTISLENVKFPERAISAIKSQPLIQIITMKEAYAKAYAEYVTLNNQIQFAVAKKVKNNEDILHSEWAGATKTCATAELSTQLYKKVQEQVKLRGLYDKEFLYKWASDN